MDSKAPVRKVKTILILFAKRNGMPFWITSETSVKYNRLMHYRRSWRFGRYSVIHRFQNTCVRKFVTVWRLTNLPLNFVLTWSLASDPWLSRPLGVRARHVVSFEITGTNDSSSKILSTPNNEFCIVLSSGSFHNVTTLNIHLTDQMSRIQAPPRWLSWGRLLYQQTPSRWFDCEIGVYLSVATITWGPLVCWWSSIVVRVCLLANILGRPVVMTSTMNLLSSWEARSRRWPWFVDTSSDSKVFLQGPSLFCYYELELGDSSFCQGPLNVSYPSSRRRGHQLFFQSGTLLFQGRQRKTFCVFVVLSFYRPQYLSYTIQQGTFTRVSSYYMVMPNYEVHNTVFTKHINWAFALEFCSAVIQPSSNCEQSHNVN